MVDKSFTKSQSGVEGMLRVEDSLIILGERNIDDIIDTTIANRMELQVSNFRLSNLDKLYNPIKILEKNNNPTTLYNSENLGVKDEYIFRKLGNVFKNVLSESNYIDGTKHMRFELKGHGSPFEMKKDIDLSISIPHIQMISAFEVFIIKIFLWR